MEGRNDFATGLLHVQGLARDFTPITVSADFSALGSPKCRNDDATEREEAGEEK